MAQQNISLGDAKKGKDVYRGASAQVQSNNLEQNLMGNMGTQMSAKSASSQQQTQPFGGNTEQVMTLENDSAQTGTKPSLAPQIEVIPDVSADVQVQSHNNTSTVPCGDMSCQQAMSKLQLVLGSWKGEIDFSSDEDKLEIAKGLVFIDGFHGVHFGIYVFSDEETKTTRWEFRRLSGDAMASAKFLAQIKTAFFAKEEQTEDDQNDATTLQALPLDTSEMKMDLSDDQKDMMMIHEALISDELGVELDEAAENFLTSKLVEMGAISKENISKENAIDQAKLVKALATEEVLYHKDVAVQRAAMIILAKFTKDFGDQMKAAKLPEMLQNVRKQAEFSSIQKRVDNLSKLLE